MHYLRGRFPYGFLLAFEFEGFAFLRNGRPADVAVALGPDGLVLPGVGQLVREAYIGSLELVTYVASTLNGLLKRTQGLVRAIPREIQMDWSPVDGTHQVEEHWEDWLRNTAKMIGRHRAIFGALHQLNPHLNLEQLARIMWENQTRLCGMHGHLCMPGLDLDAQARVVGALMNHGPKISADINRFCGREGSERLRIAWTNIAERERTWDYKAPVTDWTGLVAHSRSFPRLVHEIAEEWLPDLVTPGEVTDLVHSKHDWNAARYRPFRRQSRLRPHAELRMPDAIDPSNKAQVTYAANCILEVAVAAIEERTVFLDPVEYYGYLGRAA